MNKREFIESISESNQMTQAAARKALNTLLSTMMETMKDGEKVTISGFGSFRVVAKAAQKGRNPQTGQPIVIPARKVVRFKPARKLTEKVG
jgi:DNA-binding protein HU-beta